MISKEYMKYLEEIEQLKEKYNLGPHQVFILNIAASFEVDDVNYEKLKKEFIEESMRF